MLPSPPEAGSLPHHSSGHPSSPCQHDGFLQLLLPWPAERKTGRGWVPVLIWPNPSDEKGDFSCPHSHLIALIWGHSYIHLPPCWHCVGSVPQILIPSWKKKKKKIHASFQQNYPNTANSLFRYVLKAHTHEIVNLQNRSLWCYLELYSSNMAVTTTLATECFKYS